MNPDEIRQAKSNRAKAAALLTLIRDARRHLSNALGQLGSARNWGIADILGGGLITNLFKHSKINGATQALSQAKPLLQTLAKELKELSLTGPIQNVGIGDFAVFADFFFDGLFADLYMQSKINELQRNLTETLRTLDRVEDALRKLDAHEAARLGGR